MKKNTIKLTRKIQVNVDLPKGEERQAAIKKLYQYQNRCYRAANMIVSHLYVQEMLSDFFYLTDGIRAKRADHKKTENGILNRSRKNTTYRVVVDAFKGEVPTDILACLNQNLSNSFHHYKDEYWRGQRSVPNFRNDMPFPFSMDVFKDFVYDAYNERFSFKLFHIPFYTYLGSDYTDKSQLLYRVLHGKLKLCSSHLQLKNGKTYWLAVFEMEKENHPLKPAKVAEASLSLAHPIVVKVGNSKLHIGNKEEFLHRRLAIQAAAQRAKSAVTYTKSGKGRKRKLKAMNRFKEKELRYVRSRLHLYSRQLIDFCVQHQAGTLMLMNQESKIKLAKEEEFVLRNWSYYDLITKIKYKAQKAGIELIVG